jgi:hypothetical protein
MRSKHLGQAVEIRLRGTLDFNAISSIRAVSGLLRFTLA